MRLVAVWVVCGAAAISWAATRTLPVALGDCREPGLAAASAGFAAALSAKLGPQLISSSKALSELKPTPSKSVEEIQRMIVQAQSDFYDLRNARAVAQIDQALAEISRLPGGVSRTNLAISAYLLQGVLHMSASRLAQADDAFTRVLRMDSDRILDPDYYSPATRDRFELIRSRLKARKRVGLKIESGINGAEVLLDGVAVGTTPYSGQVLPGEYQLVLTSGGRASFAQKVLVKQQDMTVRVDFDFEASIVANDPICLTANTGNAEHIERAARLGRLLGADEMVIVRVRSKAAGADWLTATRISVGAAQEVREGGIRIQSSDQPGEFDALVAFITTGQLSPSVVVGHHDVPAPWDLASLSPPALPNPSGSAPGGDLAIAPTAESSDGDSVGTPLYARWWVWAGAGGVVLVAAGVVASILLMQPVSCGQFTEPGFGCVDIEIPKGAP